MFKKNRKILVFGLAIIVILGVSARFIGSFIYHYLSKTEKVEANVLLVEGWMSWRTMREAYHEFQNGDYDIIVTTGVSAPDYFLMAMEGYLIFNTNSLESEIENGQPHTIEVTARGELDGEHCSHFNFYVNDSIIQSFCAGTKEKKYGITWNGPLADIDSIMVHFDNDSMGHFGDHNLFVKDIIVDNNIAIPYKGNSAYLRTARKWERRFENDFETYAGIAKDRLTDFGMDPDKITPLPCNREVKNRTLSSALEFKHWADTTGFDFKGVNVVSYGPHARRTWMTYQNIMNDNYPPVGIISIYTKDRYFDRRMKFIVLKEILGNIYYWLILHLKY